jgi:hypothetical protein
LFIAAKSTIVENTKQTRAGEAKSIGKNQSGIRAIGFKK